MAAGGDGGVKRHQVEGEHRPTASHSGRVEGEGRPADLRHPVKRPWLQRGCLICGRMRDIAAGRGGITPHLHHLGPLGFRRLASGSWRPRRLACWTRLRG
jgi:hypothetical protein